MPDAQKMATILRKAAILFRATPGRTGSIVSIKNVDDVMVVGDLHGNVLAFRQCFDIAALDQNPRRHLVLQELVHGPHLYPDDGGDKSHQLVDLVAALKCRYPDRVHLILGNHELSELTGRSISKNGVAINDLFRQGVETAYGSSASDIMNAYHDLFRSLPLAVRTPNRVFVCHTIPDGRDLDRLDLNLLKTGIWPPESLERRGTIYALTWGRDTTIETADRFASLVDADWFVTGHQPCDGGFRRTTIVRSSSTAPIPIRPIVSFCAKTPTALDLLIEGVPLADSVVIIPEA